MENQKIVYFAGAIRGDRSLAPFMRQSVEYIKDLGFTILTEHIAADDPVAAQNLTSGKELSAEDIERRDIQWLDQATHVVAEISGASTGSGREIEYARTKCAFGKTHADVLCLYRQGREFFASPMIRGITPDRYPNVAVRSYRDIAEAKLLVKEFLGFKRG